jgi:HTH-type transcriptional regulator/antitoxin MqsA
VSVPGYDLAGVKAKAKRLNIEYREIQMTNCKLCQSENVTDFVEAEGIAYKGSELQVSIAYSVCNDCKREFISKPQILQNEAALRNAKKEFDGLLSSEEIVRARQELSLTQEQASRVFGGGRNAFSKYERGEVSQSIAMDKLIRICLNHREVFQELARELNEA